jgi:hypothetical protein
MRLNKWMEESKLVESLELKDGWRVHPTTPVSTPPLNPSTVHSQEKDRIAGWYEGRFEAEERQTINALAINYVAERRRTLLQRGIARRADTCEA